MTHIELMGLGIVFCKGAFFFCLLMLITLVFTGDVYLAFAEKQ